MVERAVAAWEHLQLSQISNDRALRAPLDEFGSIPRATMFRLSAASAVLTVRILRHFPEAVQDRTDSSKDITRHQRFCTAA